MKGVFPRLHFLFRKARKLGEGGSGVEYLLLLSLLALASVAAGNLLASRISQVFSQITATANAAFGISNGNSGNQDGGGNGGNGGGGNVGGVGSGAAAVSAAECVA